MRQDVAHINPWVAGVLSQTLPATGVGTFTGNAFGAVNNAGQAYLPPGSSQHLQFRNPDRDLRSAISTARAFPEPFRRHWRDLWRAVVGIGSDGLGDRGVLRKHARQPGDRDRGQLRRPIDYRAALSGLRDLCRQTLTIIFGSAARMRLICYPTSGDPPKIVAAPVQRAWMDRTDQGFAYRCLPLNIANAHGWLL